MYAILEKPKLQIENRSIIAEGWGREGLTVIGHRETFGGHRTVLYILIKVMVPWLCVCVYQNSQHCTRKRRNFTVCKLCFFFFFLKACLLQKRECIVRAGGPLEGFYMLEMRDDKSVLGWGGTDREAGRFKNLSRGAYTPKMPHSIRLASHSLFLCHLYEPYIYTDSFHIYIHNSC